MTCYLIYTVQKRGGNPNTNLVGNDKSGEHLIFCPGELIFESEITIFRSVNFSFFGFDLSHEPAAACLSCPSSRGASDM